MNTLIAWIHSKSLTSHSVAGVAVLIAGVITADPQARDFVLALFQKHPAIGTDIVALAGIILKYSHSSSPAGAVAAAQVIEASPAAPTQAEIAAAKPVVKGV